MDKLRILIVQVGHPTTPSFVNSLINNSEREIEVIGADTNPSIVLQKLFSAVYKVPKFSESQYIDEILKICKKEFIDIFWPRHETDTVLTSQRQREFDKLKIKVIRPANHKILEISNNKGKFHKFFNKHAIPHAKYKIVKRFDELEQSIYELGFPEKKVFLKPTESSGGRGSFLINNTIQYNKNTKYDGISEFSISSTLAMFAKIPKGEFPETVLMEYLPGKIYSVDVLSKNGDVIYCVPKIRIQGTASNSTIGEVNLNKDVIKIVKTVCSKFGFSYLQNYEIKENDLGEPIIYDINPRGGASVGFCTAADVNLIYFAIKMALNEDIPKNKKIINHLKMIRSFQEHYEKLEI